MAKAVVNVEKRTYKPETACEKSWSAYGQISLSFWKNIVYNFCDLPSYSDGRNRIGGRNRGMLPLRFGRRNELEPAFH